MHIRFLFLLLRRLFESVHQTRSFFENWFYSDFRNCTGLNAVFTVLTTIDTAESPILWALQPANLLTCDA